MKILWLHQYFATPRGWGAVRTYEFARRFVKAGHGVDVVCCTGYDASLKKTRHNEPIVIEGVRVFVSGTAYRPHMGFVRRVVSFLQFMVFALVFVFRRGREYDVVIASSGPLTLAVPALIGWWLKKIPFVFEVIDVWPDSAIAAGVLKNPILKWTSFKLESLVYRYAKAIVTCSTGMTERVNGKIQAQLNAKKRPQVETISNCCDLDRPLLNEGDRKEARARLGASDDQMIVLYTGAMGRSNAIEDIIGAVQGTMKDKRIVWWFAGDGPERAKLELVIGKQEMGDERKPAHCFFGKLSKEAVFELYCAADVNVVTFMHESLFYENSPNKFFDGIAAGLPTVFNRSTWLEPWLVAYDCGIICEGSQKDGMAEILLELVDDTEKRKQMGKRARLLAEEVFSRDRHAEEYLKIFENS